MVDLASFGLLQTRWREHVATSDHDQLGKVGPGQTMQLDALPDELIEGLTGEDSGYQLAEAGAGPSAPPPLPPRGSSAPPATAGGDDGSRRTMIIAVVVAVLMAVAGVVFGTIVLGEEEAPAEPPPVIELGDIEVQSH